MVENTLTVKDAIKVPVNKKNTIVSFYSWDGKNMRKVTIEENDAEPSEELIESYYESKGFLAFNVEPNPRKNERNIDSLPPKVREEYRKHPSVNEEIIAGTPDIIVYNPETQDIFYVEVKKGKDTLKKNQFDFMHVAEKNCFVAWINKVDKVTQYEFKCPRCKDSYELEKDFRDHDCKKAKSDSMLASDEVNWGAWGYANPDN